MRVIEPDEDAQRARLQLAHDAMELWSCPGASAAEPTDVTDDAKRSLQAVGALTGLQDLRTCPLWYASQPCAHAASRARRWRDKGQLGNLDEQPAALADAIDQIDFAVEDRQQDDDRRRKEKRANQ